MARDPNPKEEVHDNRVELPGAIDDLRWKKDRTGWAPRFDIVPTQADKEAATLLDKQTFLEMKLDDKFYGGVLSHYFLSTSQN